MVVPYMQAKAINATNGRDQSPMVTGVHINQLADIFATGHLYGFAVAVLDICTQGQEDDRQHCAGDVADVEVEKYRRGSWKD